MKYIAVPANQISQQTLCKIMPRPFGPEDYITFIGKPKPPSKPPPSKPPPSKPASKPASKLPSKPKPVRALVNVQKNKDGSKTVTVAKK